MLVTSMKSKSQNRARGREEEKFGDLKLDFLKVKHSHPLIYPFFSSSLFQPLLPKER